jgi:hypothetical protein
MQLPYDPDHIGPSCYENVQLLGERLLIYVVLAVLTTQYL